MREKIKTALIEGIDEQIYISMLTRSITLALFALFNPGHPLDGAKHYVGAVSGRRRIRSWTV